MNKFADFNIAFNLTMSAEGGYVNDKDDSGGETYMGVARNFNPEWSGWKLIDALKNKSDFPKCLDKEPVVQNAVKEIYKLKYWDALKLSEINNQAIANELFDTAVNMGVGTAGKFLQLALNITNRNQKDYSDIPVDGKIGNITIATTNNHPRQNTLLKALNLYQGAKYLAIVESNPAKEKFLIGWLERVQV